MFSFEYCKILKNTCFEEDLLKAASSFFQNRTPVSSCFFIDSFIKLIYNL